MNEEAHTDEPAKGLTRRETLRRFGLGGAGLLGAGLVGGTLAFFIGRRFPAKGKGGGQ